MFDDLIYALKAVLGVLMAIGLAIFAKRYSDMKRKAEKQRMKEVADEIIKTTDSNNSMPIDDLIERENARFRKE